MAGWAMATAGLVAAAAALAGCEEGAPLSERWGRVLPAGAAACPPNHVAYVLKAGDTLYGLGEMFYGKGWRWYLIYEANRGALESDPDFWQPGRIILIPPDLNGIPVTVKTPAEYR